MPRTVRYEICLDSAAGVAEAAAAGADRVELCADLLEGGITPSAGMIAQAVAAAEDRLRVHVLIRPRGGDFVYGRREVAAMLHDIETAKRYGAQGIVIGALTADGAVDMDVCAELVAAARPASVTFHRAFDVSRDPLTAFERVVELGADRLLTSGAAPSALEGSALIAELVRRAGDRITILPAGGIDERTAARVVAETGASELHFTATRTAGPHTTFTRPDVHMGGALFPPEHLREVTTADRIRDIVAASRAA